MRAAMKHRKTTQKQIVSRFFAGRPPQNCHNSPHPAARTLMRNREQSLFPTAWMRVGNLSNRTGFVSGQKWRPRGNSSRSSTARQPHSKISEKFVTNPPELAARPIPSGGARVRRHYKVRHRTSDIVTLGVRVPMVDAQNLRKFASDRDGLNIPVRGAMAGGHQCIWSSD